MARGIRRCASILKSSMHVIGPIAAILTIGRDPPSMVCARGGEASADDAIRPTRVQRPLRSDASSYCGPDQGPLHGLIRQAMPDTLALSKQGGVRATLA